MNIYLLPLASFDRSLSQLQKSQINLPLTTMILIPTFSILMHSHICPKNQIPVRLRNIGISSATPLHFTPVHSHDMDDVCVHEIAYVEDCQNIHRYRDCKWQGPGMFWIEWVLLLHEVLRCLWSLDLFIQS